ncbi:hypothetical protein [Flavobacterium sp. J27]|uniref:hypothetical protein n=1 Tax=Flavobacterium sp. J27 TaxID=2060419 RepID=UPI0010306ACF|nr:hypothetical protein [Flavobacterium sp. J27]
MPINSTTGSVITLAEAQELVNAFRNIFPKDIKGSFVGADSLHDILKQDGCIGVRIYYGYDTVASKLSPVLVGVDATGKDMTDGGVILDKLKPCPDECDPTSPIGNPLGR